VQLRRAQRQQGDRPQQVGPRGFRNRFGQGLDGRRAHAVQVTVESRGGQPEGRHDGRRGFSLVRVGLGQVQQMPGGGRVAGVEPFRRHRQHHVCRRVGTGHGGDDGPHLEPTAADRDVGPVAVQHVGRQLPFAGREQMPQRLDRWSLNQMPVGRPAVRPADTVAVMPGEFPVQHPAEHRMQPVPVTRGGGPADERALPLQVGQDGGAVDAVGERVEQTGGQALGDRGLHQHMAHLWIKRGQHLGAEIVGDEVDRPGVQWRLGPVGMVRQSGGGEPETGGPTLHPGVQIRDGQTGQRHLLASEQAGRLVDGEREFVLPEHEKLPVHPPPVQGQRRSPAAGQHQPHPPAAGPHHLRQICQRARTGDIIAVVDHDRQGRRRVPEHSGQPGRAVRRIGGGGRLGQDRCTGGDRGRHPVPESGPAATGHPDGTAPLAVCPRRQQGRLSPAGRRGDDDEAGVPGVETGQQVRAGDMVQLPAECGHVGRTGVERRRIRQRT
jgi:hypothetical protein